MDCNLSFICGKGINRSYTMNFINGKTEMWPCGDNVKNLQWKKTTFSVEDHAKTAAQFLMVSGLCRYVKLEGNVVEWECSNTVKSNYTFRVVRNCRYHKFVDALKKAIKYQEKINPVISLGYFFSKQEHEVSNGYASSSIFQSSMDMLNTSGNYGFMNQSKYEALTGADHPGSYMNLYPTNNTQTFNQLIEQWNNN